MVKIEEGANELLMKAAGGTASGIQQFVAGAVFRFTQQRMDTSSSTGKINAQHYL